MPTSPTADPVTVNGPQADHIRSVLEGITPAGYAWVLKPTERAEGSRPTRTYAWRVYEDEEVLIDALTETFRSKRASDALRWLFEQPAVRQTMFERIQGAK